MSEASPVRNETLSPALLERLRDDAPLSRRDLLALGAATMATAAMAACGGGGDANGGSGGPTGPGPGVVPTGVTIAGAGITVNLTIRPELAAPGSFLVVTSGTANAIIICLGANNWKAFTPFCTHQQCVVTSFAANRINCPCHGSQFDTNGNPVAGPAPTALTSFTVAFASSTNTLQVTTTS